MERLTFLGSAFAIANALQENSYLLLQTAGHTVLIDCGNNPVGRLEQVGVALTDITDLVLTHAHADHMGALPLLMMDIWLRKRKAPLNIYGLDYTLFRAKALLDIFGWQNWKEMFPVEFHAVADNESTVIIQAPDLRLTVAPVKHLIPNIGLRMELPHAGKTFVYSSDTEPCDNLERLAEGADLLIQQAAGPGTGHTSPEQAGIVAARAGVQKLALIHYDAAKLAQGMIDEAKLNFAGEVVLAKDLMFFE